MGIGEHYKVGEVGHVIVVTASQLEQLSHPGMTSMDGMSPRISRWEVVIRTNLHLLLGLGDQEDASKYDLEVVHERCRSCAEELDVPVGCNSQVTP